MLSMGQKPFRDREGCQRLMLRSLETIDANVDAVSREIMELLAEVHS